MEVFYWGDDDTANNGVIDPGYLDYSESPPEVDNQEIPSSDLYNGHGILIPLGGNHPYRYVRISAPSGCDDPAQIDAIDYLP